MPSFPGDLPAPDIPPVHVPAVPEVVTVPDDLPTIRPDVVVELPASEWVSDAIVVPAEHNGEDVLYLAVSQQRVNVWAAAVYFVPEIALGVCGLVVLVAVRKLWTRRRFTHRRGEPYCKKCLAGLTGVESDTCPECGRPVAKTRRVAKRPRRLPLSPAWCWAIAAVLVSLGTATLWYGESWLRLRDRGFDLRDTDDWWALVNPVDRESPVRINKAASWLDWRSARLAAYARERDHAWIDKLDWEYKDGEGVTYRLLVRRYATTDGSLLSEDMLPAESYWQDGSQWDTSPVNLYHLAGVILADDYDALYRYRPDHAVSWVKVGEIWDSEMVHTASAVSPDGRYAVTETRKRIGDGLFDLSYGDTTLTVVDLNTGEPVAVLQVTASEVLIDQLNPTLTPIAGSAPPTDTLRFAYESFIPIDVPGKLVLVSEDVSVTWDFLNHTLAMDDPTILWPERLHSELVLDFSSSMSRGGGGGGGGLFAGPPRYLKMRDAEFDRVVEELVQTGARQATLNTIAADVEGFGRYGQFDPPWDQFSLATDVPVYNLADATSAYQPDRIMRIEGPSRGEMSETWLSPDGRWLDVAYRSRQFRGPDNRAWLRVDMDTAQPAGWFSEGVRRSWIEGQYVNGGSRFLVVGEVDRPSGPQYSAYNRVEIHLYHLPDE